MSTGKCDTSLLKKYGDNDFVIDDDIVKKSSSIIYEIHDKTFSNKTSDKLLKPFNPSKPFKIKCSCIFYKFKTNLSNVAFVIANGSVNLTCCKANIETGNSINDNSYWFSADQLNEWHYGIPAIGQKFEYSFEYKGDKATVISSSNLNFVGTLSDSLIYNPRNLESDIIWFCYDPRNSSSEVGDVYFDYLVIEQD